MNRLSAPIALLAAAFVAHCADWPMRGGNQSRNAVSLETNAPTDWDIGSETKFSKRPSRNILWSAKLGSYSLGDPVIANGLVWVGTNNDEPRDPNQTKDCSVLMCFRERDGKFLYQYVSPRLAEGILYDWPNNGLFTSDRRGTALVLQ